MPALHKDSEAEVQTKSGGKYKYQYLGLEALLAQVLPVLNENGIALVQAPIWEDAGFHALTTTLVHESGEELRSIMRLPVASDASAQVLGSALTYGRRYAVLAVLALAPDEDDDGAAAQRQGSSEAGDARAESPSGTEPHAPASEGSSDFQPPATQKPATQGLLDELNTMLRVLNNAFPNHPGEGRTWETVAKEHMIDLWVKDSVRDLTVAEMRELISWLEDQHRDAAQVEEMGI